MELVFAKLDTIWTTMEYVKVVTCSAPLVSDPTQTNASLAELADS